MKVEVQFAGYHPISIDTENASPSVFDKPTTDELLTALEDAVNGGDEDESGWIAANIGGEPCQVRRAS